MDLIVGVPKELFRELAERWLGLKELVILDSGFCNHTARSILLEYMRMNVAPILSTDGHYFRTMNDVVEWLMKRKIILETANFGQEDDPTMWNSYLRKFGKYVKTVRFRDSTAFSVVAKYCPNVQFVDCIGCESSESIIGLLSLYEQRESIRVHGCFNTEHFHQNMPATHHLRVKDLAFECGGVVETTIFKLCLPEGVQRLRCGSIHHQDWTQFTSLRSLGFQQRSNIDASHLVQVFQQCTSITELDLSNVYATNEVVIAAARHLIAIHTLNMNDNREVTDKAVFEVIKHHKDSLTVLNMNGCSKLTGNAINRALRKCPHLHILGISSTVGVDFALMCPNGMN